MKLTELEEKQKELKERGVDILVHHLGNKYYYETADDNSMPIFNTYEEALEAGIKSIINVS